MATSISEQISAKLQTRLGVIDTGSGYETTTAGVVRPTRLGGFQPKDYLIVVTQGDIARNDELSHPGNPPAAAWDIPFMVAGILRTDETTTTASDTLKNQFWADCVKAINTGTDWYQWDSLAINSTITDVKDFQASDGSASGFFLTVLVTFRTDENNPYNVRA